MTQAFFSLYVDSSEVEHVECCISQDILSLTDLILWKWEYVSHAGIRPRKMNDK